MGDGVGGLLHAVCLDGVCLERFGYIQISSELICEFLATVPVDICFDEVSTQKRLVNSSGVKGILTFQEVRLYLHLCREGILETYSWGFNGGGLPIGSGNLFPTRELPNKGNPFLPSSGPRCYLSFCMT